MYTPSHGLPDGTQLEFTRTGSGGLEVRLQGTFDLGLIPSEERPRIRSAIQAELSSVLSAVTSQMMARSTSTPEASMLGVSSSTTPPSTDALSSSVRERSTPSRYGVSEYRRWPSTEPDWARNKSVSSTALTRSMCTPPTTTMTLAGELTATRSAPSSTDSSLG